MQKQRLLWIKITAIAVVLIMLTPMFIFTVEDKYNAVVYTFGGIDKDSVKTAPGLYFRWPIGIQRVVPVDTRIRFLPVKGNEPVTTSDENQLYISIAIGWKVNDARTYIQRMTNDSGISIDVKAEEFLIDQIRNARQRAAGSVDLAKILNTDKSQKENYAAFRQKIFTILKNKVADSDYGVEITDLLLTGLALSKSNSKPTNDRMIKERDISSERNITEGKNTAQQIINEAELKRQNLISKATADARRIKGEGDAAAAEFYKEFKKNPQLANFLRKLDTLEVILQKKATVALPSNAPLESIIEQAPGTK